MTDNIVETESADTLQSIADDVLNVKKKLEDEFEVAAILESNGWTDKRANETFQVENVFMLSKEVWKILRSKRIFAPFTPMSKIIFNEYPLKFIRNFLKGSIFALPMAISVFAMLTIRFSLWSYESFDVEIATSIAIGTILSFLCIGGFTQAIAKQGYSYIKQGYYNMAKQSTFYFVRLGYLLSTAVVIIMLAGNAFFTIFPNRMLIIIVLYFFMLNAIWLAVTIMYILDKELIFSGLLALGIAIIYLLFKILKIDIIVSQVITLAIVAILGSLIALGIFVNHERKRSKEGAQPKLPRKTIILNSVISYFIYGFTYFAFLFTDRIIAWSTSNVYMPFIIWFRGEYELGLDFALLILIIPMGFVEFIVNDMMNSISETQKDYYSYEVDKMYKRYVSIYIKRLITIFVISALNGVLIHALLILIKNKYFSFINIDISPTTYFVFIVALFGYAFTAMGLLNAEILFCVAQPKMANKCISYAILVNIVVGFLLSRWISYEFAVFGLLAGSLVFVAVSTYMVQKMLKKVDYYLYVAS
ncbi:MAG: polysaccharide biosynthesis protein [Saccharofermentanales bacterium]